MPLNWNFPAIFGPENREQVTIISNRQKKWFARLDMILNNLDDQSWSSVAPAWWRVHGRPPFPRPMLQYEAALREDTTKIGKPWHRHRAPNRRIRPSQVLGRANRFSRSIMERMTAKENTNIPAARM